MPFDNCHHLSNVRCLHSDDPDEFRAFPGNLHLGIAIAIRVDVRRLVVIREDNDPKASFPQNCNHKT